MLLCDSTACCVFIYTRNLHIALHVHVTTNFRFRTVNKSTSVTMDTDGVSMIPYLLWHFMWTLLSHASFQQYIATLQLVDCE